MSFVRVTARRPVKMARAKYIAEHERLIDALKRPTPAKLRAEVKEQTADLRKARKGK